MGLRGPKTAPRVRVHPLFAAHVYRWAAARQQPLHELSRAAGWPTGYELAQCLRPGTAFAGTPLALSRLDAVREITTYGDGVIVAPAEEA